MSEFEDDLNNFPGPVATITPAPEHIEAPFDTFETNIDLLGDVADYALDFVGYMREDDMPGAVKLKLPKDEVIKSPEGGIIKAYEIGLAGIVRSEENFKDYDDLNIDASKYIVTSNLDSETIDAAEPDWFFDYDHNTRTDFRAVYLCEDGQLRTQDGKILSLSDDEKILEGVKISTTHRPKLYRRYADEIDRFYYIPLERLLPAIAYEHTGRLTAEAPGKEPKAQRTWRESVKRAAKFNKFWEAAQNDPGSEEVREEIETEVNPHSPLRVAFTGLRAILLQGLGEYEHGRIAEALDQKATKSNAEKSERQAWRANWHREAAQKYRSRAQKLYEEQDRLRRDRRSTKVTGWM